MKSKKCPTKFESFRSNFILERLFPENVRTLFQALIGVCIVYNTAISINKVVHEQSGKVEYERERLLGTALKIH